MAWDVTYYRGQTATLKRRGGMSLYRFIISVVFLSGLFLSDFASADESSENCMLIHDAQIRLPANFDHSVFGHANYGHEVKAGNRSVILIRSVTNLRGAIDSQGFSKTTFEIERLPANAEIDQARKFKVLHSYYSKGYSAWIPDGQYVWAQNIAKMISLTRKPDGLILQMDTNFTQTSAASGKKHPAHLKISCNLHEMSFDNFSAKAGKSGTEWSSFYSVDK